MRVLILGATGYVGSRLITRLLDAGDDVIAAARDLQALDAFWWSDRVERVPFDATDDASVRAGIADAAPDAIAYLIHGMGGTDFAETDLAAAQSVRAAADAADVQRIVYVSGIIPPIDESDLSEHLTSRLAVERELAQASASTLTLRAAMVIGAGSTSFELMCQLSDRLPVTVIPDWMRSLVEPIAVTDLTEAVAAALHRPELTGDLDVGGGEALEYPDLIARVAMLRGTKRPQISVPLLPEPLVAKAAALLTDLPSPTVTALMESLQEDMVAADSAWTSLLSGDPVGLDDAVRRSIAPVDYERRPSERDVQGPLPGDPEWTNESE